MNLTLHILRKDIRHLYPEILITFALTIAFAWAAPDQWLSYGGMQGGGTAIMALLLRILLPIGWLILISRLIHDESLVGDRQFWVTRPYIWTTLLSAKLLFLLVFLSLPFFLMQCYLLHHASLGIVAALPDLLRYHLRLYAIFFLPFIAIATVTATFSRQLLTLLSGIVYIGCLLALGNKLMNHRIEAPDAQSAYLTLFAAALIAVILLQYSGRRTLLSRLVLVCLPVSLVLIALGAPAKAIIERAYPASQSKSYRLAFDPTPVVQQRGMDQPLVIDRDVIISLPVNLTGLPAGVRMKGVGVAIEIDTPQGFHWWSHYEAGGADFTETNSHADIDIFMPLSTFNRIRNTPVDLRLNIAFVKFQTEASQTLQSEAEGFASPGRGNCLLLPGGQVTSCLYPLRVPPPIDLSAQVSDIPCLDSSTATTRLANTFVGNDQNALAFDFDPVATSHLRLLADSEKNTPPHAASLCPGTPITLTPHFIAGRERLSFSQKGIVLSSYVRHHMQSDPAHAAPVPEPSTPQQP
jgi:hypothetical protein